MSITVNLPNGAKAVFPDGTSPDTIKAVLAKKFPPQGAAPAAASAAAPAVDAPPAPAQPMSPGAAFDAANPQGVIPFLPGLKLGDLAAGLNTLGDVASFGLAPMIQRTIKNILEPGSGDALQENIDQVNADHPLGQAAGFAAAIPVNAMLTGGLGEGAAAMTAGTKAAPIVNALATGGGVAGDIGRMAAGGAAAAGTEAAASGEDLGSVATSAAIGGALGPLVGTAAGAVVKRVAPAAKKAWDFLAGKLHENPAQMQAYIDDYVARTNGQQPSLQQIVTDHDSGVIAQFGKNYPHAGAELNAGAREAAEALPGAARETIDAARGTLPQAPELIANVNPATASKAGLLDARDAATDAAMAPIRQTPVQLDEDMVDSLNRLNILGGRKWAEARTRLSEGTLTLDDADKIRRRLQQLNANGQFSVDVDNVLTDLVDVVEAQVPAYTELMGKYAAASRYADAFSHGASGAARGATEDAGLRAALRSAEGDAGYNAGLLSRKSSQAGGTPASAEGVLGDIARPGTAADEFQAAVNGAAAADTQAAAATLRRGMEQARKTAPGALTPQVASAGALNIATGAGSLVAGAPISAGRNIGRGILQVLGGVHLPPKIQQRVGNMLASADPVVRERALQELRRAGVRSSELKKLRDAIAVVTGAAAGSALAGTADVEFGQ